MPTNKQRRDAARRHLERQLERRQERELRRRKMTLIGSIVGTLVLIGVIVLAFAVWGKSDKKNTQSQPGGSGSSSSTPSPSASTSAAPLPKPTEACTKTTGSTVTFKGVTVKNATNLKIAPVSTSKVTTIPAALECADLVVGTGALATPTSTVSVQYVGTLLSTGKIFDSSWQHGGKPISFPLTGVVPGFTQGIGGAGKVAPMRIGGRRIMIFPASLGYGASGSGPIPANASLVFIVDLTKVTPATSAASS